MTVKQEYLDYAEMLAEMWENGTYYDNTIPVTSGEAMKIMIDKDMDLWYKIQEEADKRRQYGIEHPYA